MPRYTARQRNIVSRVKEQRGWKKLTLEKLEERLGDVSNAILKKSMRNASKIDPEVKAWSESSYDRRAFTRGVREIEISGKQVRLTGKEMEIFPQLEKIKHFNKLSAKHLSKVFHVDQNTIHNLMKKLIEIKWSKAVNWKKHEKMYNPSLYILSTKELISIPPKILKILPNLEKMNLKNTSGHKLSQEFNVSRNALSNSLTTLAINGHEKALEFKRGELNRTYNKLIRKKITEDIRQGEMAIKLAKAGGGKGAREKKLEILREAEGGIWKDKGLSPIEKLHKLTGIKKQIKKLK